MTSRLSRRSLFLHATALAAAEWPELAVETPGYGQSSPVSWGDRLFFSAVEGAEKELLIVFCVDAATGRQLWRREFPATQRIKNVDTTSKAAPMPCVDRDRLYVFFESGDLISLDHSGRPEWHRKLTEVYGPFRGNHGVGSSPRLTAKGLVVLVSHGGPCYLLSVDRRTGKNQWRTERESKVAWTTPNIIRRAEQESIVVSVNGRVESYDATTGASQWSVDGINTLSSATVAGTMLVIGSSEKGNLAALNLDVESGAKPQTLWKAENATCYFGSPLIHRNRIWLASKVGVGYCLDRKTGQELWSGRLAGECWTSPLGAAGHVYFCTVKGVTEVFPAEGPFQKVAENTLDNMERTYGVAVLNDGLVLRSGRRSVKVSNKRAESAV